MNFGRSSYKTEYGIQMYICPIQCDKILEVDVNRQRVRVETGITIGELVEALKPFNLTLQNFASIREQQVGGFVQAGCHGTGALIPPVDEQVVEMKIVTPGLGTIVLDSNSSLSNIENIVKKEEDERNKITTNDKGDDSKDLFYLARVGMGLLGVVTEVTLQCVPRHRLIEHTYVLSADSIHEGHEERIKKHKHMRYMWIPYTVT